MTLQGCGCDKDKATKCVSGNAVTASSTGDSVCEGLSKCLKDADCCDYEESGIKMKDVVANLCTTVKAAEGKNKC